MTTTMMERAEEIERAMIEELDRHITVKSVLYMSGARDPTWTTGSA